MFTIRKRDAKDNEIVAIAGTPSDLGQQIERHLEEYPLDTLLVERQRGGDEAELQQKEKQDQTDA